MSQLVSTASLVEYWKLDEPTTGPRSGSFSNNHLTDVNTTPSGSGIIGPCADFEFANDEYLTIENNANLQLGVDQPFTFTFWFNAESVEGVGGTHCLSGKGVNVNLNAREFGFRSVDGNKLRWDVGYGYNQNVTITLNWSMPTGSWHFVAGWHDPDANVIGMWLDCSGSVLTTANTNGTWANSGSFNIGTIGKGVANNNFDGRIDEVGYWKQVLTTAEISQLYNSGSGLSFPFTSSEPPEPPVTSSYRTIFISWICDDF